MVEDVFEKSDYIKEQIILQNGKKLGAVDSPPLNLPKFEDLKRSGKLKPGTAHMCLIKASQLFSDTDYNKPDQLNLHKAIASVNKAKGFSYSHSNALVAYMRPDGVIVLTQGNHRTIMALYCCGIDTDVVVNLRIHDNTLSIKECKKIEAIDFNTDALQRESHKQGQKFRGAYMAEEVWAINLYDFLKEYKVSVAKTNTIKIGPFPTFTATKTFETYSKLQEIMRIDDSINYSYVRQALDSLTKNLVEPDINGSAFCGLVIFLMNFSSTLNSFHSKGYSLDDFIHYIYNEYRTERGLGRLLVQKDIAKSGSLNIKTYHYFASRYVTLFNEYARVRKMKKRQNEVYAISESSKEWINFTAGLDQVARQIYKVWDAVA